jgi:predicted O-linked N-acetylglucosamine transferase (SPINDLY family)
MDDATAAGRMIDDGIQILVDVNGYTREARTKLLALRPAPVIVNWLGFPGTMASPYHRYIIADDWIIPPSHEIYYTEKVLRLPCYQPNNRERTITPLIKTRQQAGLPDDAMVYCCFNGSHKISRFTFERWLMILGRVPGSVLWLLGSTDATNDRLKAYAVQRGIQKERIVFAEKLVNSVHLGRYPLADLFLDTAPYGAHTTASDALWMGLPVLTLSGRSFASRVCGSLVRSAGVGDLICASAEDYVDRAVAFGLDRSLLHPYRETLAAERDRCPLFDTPSLVRHLEALFREMWDDYEKDRLPQPDLTDLDAFLEVGMQIDHDVIEVQTVEDYQTWWQTRLDRRHQARPLSGAAGRRLAAVAAVQPAEAASPARKSTRKSK